MSAERARPPPSCPHLIGDLVQCRVRRGASIALTDDAARDVVDTRPKGRACNRLSNGKRLGQHGSERT